MTTEKNRKKALEELEEPIPLPTWAGSFVHRDDDIWTPTKAGFGVMGFFLILTFMPLIIEAPLVAFFCILFVGALIYLGIREIRKSIESKREFMKKFGEIYGFKFSRKGSFNDEIGIIFKDNGWAHNVLEGKILDRPFRLTTYKRGEDAGDSPWIFTVLSLDFGMDLPRMYLDAHGVGDAKALPWKTKGLKATSLESNEFNSQYRLFVTKGQHIPALQVFTPDIMEKLIDIPKEHRFDIEIIKNKVYIYESEDISTKDELVAMFDLAKHLVENLGRVLDRI